MKDLDTQKSVFNYLKNNLGYEFKTLNFRFPIETLATLLKKFFKDYEEPAFLVQAGKSFSDLALIKISKSYLLQVPIRNQNNERLYIGLSDLFCFLILFDEPDPKEQNITEQKSRFFLTFDYSAINEIFDYFYKNYCKSLSIKEKKLLIKLKNVNPGQLEPYYINKFQEALLISALNENNKIKQTKIAEALSFTGESILVTDLAGNIKERNKNFKEQFKASRNINNIREILSKDLVESALKETNAHGKWQSELSLLPNGKKSELLLISSYLFKDDLERPNGYVFTFKDVTELRKLDYLNKELISKLRERNVQLSDVNKRLLEADRIKSDLLSVVSHELKTPISTIVGFSELISNRDMDGKTARAYADQITNSAKHLDRLVTDYLDVASNQFGISSNQLHTMPVNLADLIRVSYKEEEIKFRDMIFNFELNCLGYKPIIISEAENLHKLFCNLINNSLKYSPNGGKITVKILNDSETVTVSLADQGIGMTIEQARHVFEPFYRADNSVTREFSGIGLGLAVCKKIVEMYGGSIWCEGGIDLGTVFYVTLPVNPHKVSKKAKQDVYKEQHVEAEKG